jgi:hypothetical protein
VRVGKEARDHILPHAINFIILFIILTLTPKNTGVGCTRGELRGEPSGLVGCVCAVARGRRMWGCVKDPTYIYAGLASCAFPCHELFSNVHRSTKVVYKADFHEISLSRVISPHPLPFVLLRVQARDFAFICDISARMKRRRDVRPHHAVFEPNVPR